MRGIVYLNAVRAAEVLVNGAVNIANNSGLRVLRIHGHGQHLTRVTSIVKTAGGSHNDESTCRRGFTYRELSHELEPSWLHGFAVSSPLRKEASR